MWKAISTKIMNFHTVNIKKGKEKEKREFPHCQKLCPCPWEQFGYWLCNLLATQNVKKTNPGISFTELGRVLGEKWKKMSGMRNIFRLVSSFVESSSHSVTVMVPSTFGGLVGLMFLTVLVAGFFNSGDGRNLFVNFSLHCLVVTSQLTRLIFLFFFYVLFSLFVLRSRGERALWSQGSAR